MEDIVTVAISKITAALGDKVMNEVKNKLSVVDASLRALPEDLEDVRNGLDMLRSVIRDLDSVDIGKNVGQNWIICKLRKVAFRADDIMDKYSYHAFKLHKESSLTRLFKRHYTQVFNDIADEVVKIKIEIKNVREHRRAGLPIDQIVQTLDRPGSQTASFLVHVQDEDLVGIASNQRYLIEWLFSSEPDSTVIMVSGMGGLGKSTLVANVYGRVRNSFGVNAWIAVSQTYTMEDLLKELLQKIGYTENNIDKMDNNRLKQEIRSRLDFAGKCLVVLDDIWDREVYEKMQDVFRNLQSSYVIITTRRDDVASLASPRRHVQLQPLKRADALHIFYAKAFGNTVYRKCPLELEFVAAQIVEKCNGLPLALVSMGGLMSTKQQTEHAWTEVFKQFQSELPKSDNVQAILTLSYNNLPGNLRSCFLYCSLFPEDYTISRESLVRQWVAEGFAVADEDNTPEDVAELNLMELITRNMLQVEDYDELGRVSTCKMHDLVRDLALSLARKEKFGSANHHGTMSVMEKDVRRLSSYGWEDSDSHDLPNLRTLMSLEAKVSATQMLSSIFTGSPYATLGFKRTKPSA